MASSTKKIKSQGRKVFIINEFIIERILFFGKNTNGVKTVKSKKSCVSINLIAMLRLYYNDETDEISKSA